ncbi:XrtA system polysaccharide deacetylase [Bdellovibrio sp. HCB288]|uniref:XrtA system polysaccharide deacetylase n=1 Tax=Bdellovibrio sp. HCB288 TaxID=3394355 RepID=UPI0039B557BA
MSTLTNNQNKSKHHIALSFDVEDWFTVRNMRDFVSDSDWDKQEMRVNVGMDFILEALAEKNIKATFYILGWLADRAPELVKKIADQGHEIGCHSYQHTPIDLLDPKSFEADLKKAISALETVSGQKIKGFRAPSFSVMHKTSWALPIIRDCGLEYDSSIFVTSHPDYGVRDFPTTITTVSGLTEVPLKKSKFFGTEIPVCGGGYFRMLPYALTKSALKQDLENGPVVMYFHPWEFDPKQPRVALPAIKRFRHYVGLNSNRDKFLKLLNDFEFTTVESLVQDAKATNKLTNYSFA